MKKTFVLILLAILMIVNACKGQIRTKQIEKADAPTKVIVSSEIDSLGRWQTTDSLLVVTSLTLLNDSILIWYDGGVVTWDTIRSSGSPLVVSNDGTGSVYEIPVFTNSNTIEGSPELTYNGTRLQVANTSDQSFILKATDVGVVSGTPEAGYNYMGFYDADDDRQAYFGIDASGNIVLVPEISGATVNVTNDLLVSDSLKIGDLPHDPTETRVLVNSASGWVGYKLESEITGAGGSDDQTLSIDSTGRVFSISIESGNTIKFEDTNEQQTFSEGYGIDITNVGIDYEFEVDTSQIATIYDVDSSAYWTLSGNKLYSNYDTVGIGTTTPDYPLEVSGRVSQINTGESTYFGYQAGDADDYTNNENVGIGFQTLKSTNSTTKNVAIGHEVLENATASHGNVLLGHGIMRLNSTPGNYNVGVGYDVFGNTYGAEANVALGGQALNSLYVGDHNVGIAYKSLELVSRGSYNIGIGRYAGGNLTTADYCIMIGDDVDGVDATSDYQLNIQNAITGDMTPSDVEIKIEGELLIDEVNLLANDTILVYRNDTVGYALVDGLQTNELDGIISMDVDTALVMRNDSFGYRLISDFPYIGDLNGFSIEERDSCTLNFNDDTRKFYIEPIGDDFKYWDDGLEYTVTAADSVLIDNTAGLHVIYYSGSTLTAVVSPTHAQVEDVILNNTIVAYVYWNWSDEVHYGIGDERHSLGDRYWHRWAHETHGATYAYGFGLTDMSVDASGDLETSAMFGVASGQFYDEDLDHTIGSFASTDTIPIFYKHGADGEWRRILQDSFRVTNSGSGRAEYNEWTGTVWQLTDVTNLKYLLMHVFATNDVDYPTVIIVGENEYSNIASARAGAETEIFDLTTDGLPDEEFVPLGTVIFQTANTYTNTVQSRVISTDQGDDYIDWRYIDIIGGGGSGGTTSSFLDLTDSPNTYTSQSGKIVAVNSTEDAVEFVDAESVFTEVQSLDDVVTEGDNTSQTISVGGVNVTGTSDTIKIQNTSSVFGISSTETDPFSLKYETGGAYEKRFEFDLDVGDLWVYEDDESKSWRFISSNANQLVGYDATDGIKFHVIADSSELRLGQYGTSYIAIDGDEQTIDINGDEGTDGEVLTVQADGSVDWESTSISNTFARYYNSSSLSLSTSYQKIPFNTEAFDPDSQYSISSNQITVPEVGYYEVHFEGRVSATSGGSAKIAYYIAVNNSIAPNYTTKYVYPGASESFVTPSSDIIYISNISYPIDVRMAAQSGSATFTAYGHLTIKKLD